MLPFRTLRIQLTSAHHKENTVYTVFSFLAYAALACLVIALWKPRIYPLKNPTRAKAAGFYLVAFIVFFVLSGFGGPGDSQRGTLSPSALQEAGQPASDKVATLSVLKKEKVAMPGNGRNRLQVTLCMYEDQAGATQQDLVSIATREAMKYQKESGAPVVLLSLVSQKAENALGEMPLAHVVYIPDGKGFDGASKATSPWETLRAAKRGFSESELKYLHLWAKNYRNYQSSSGAREKALDAAVSAELGVAPGTIKPFDNTLEPVVAPTK